MEHVLKVGVDVEVCGCSVSGNLAAAVTVLQRMMNMGQKPTVHVYNSLIQACERHKKYDLALYYAQCLKRDGLTPNDHTKYLLQVSSHFCLSCFLF